jgi:threonine/homoserine/homoserine lactone efflux protein
MTYDQSVAFLAFSVVAAVTPGPSNVMITATGAAAGIARGLPCVLGASLGMASLLFTSQLGAGALITGNPAILTALNWGGAALLLWMSWKIANAGADKGELTPRPVGFLGAAIFQWLNPKGWLVAVSAAGAYSQAVSLSPLGDALAFAGLFFIAAFPSGLVWLVFGALMRSFLGDERKARIFNIAMGLLLAASVILMLV